MANFPQNVSVLLVGLAALSGCAGEKSVLSFADGKFPIETRVAILDSCPRSEKGARQEAAIAAAIAAALIPAIIDVGLSTLGTALENAAKEDVDTKQAQTVGRFYGATSQASRQLLPYEIRPNTDNGCLVIAHGPVTGSQSKVDFEDRAFYGSSAVAKLWSRLGLQSDPWFYYEGQFVYSADGTAFRIETQVVNYQRTLKSGGRGTRGLSLALTFSIPGSNGTGTAFAAATIPFGDITTSDTREGQPLLGTSAAASFSSPWLPMPPISTESTAALSDARLRLSGLNETAIAIKSAYISHVDKTAREQIEPIDVSIDSGIEQLVKAVDKEKVKVTLDKLAQGITTVTAEIVADRITLDERIVALERAREKEASRLTGVEEIQREIALERALLTARNALQTKEIALARAIEARGEVRPLLDVERTLKSAAEHLQTDANRLRRFRPFTISASVTEKQDANAVLAFLAAVFNKAKEGLSQVAKNELDPAARKALQEQQEKDNAARQDAFNDERKKATMAVISVQGAEIDLELLPIDAGPAVVHQRRAALRSAQLDAIAACQKAARLGAQPGLCSPYL